MKCSDNCSREILHEMLQQSIDRIIMKITYTKLYLNLPGANELIQWYFVRVVHALRACVLLRLGTGHFYAYVSSFIALPLLVSVPQHSNIWLQQRHNKTQEKNISMGSAKTRLPYTATSSITARGHTQNDPWNYVRIYRLYSISLQERDSICP